MHKRSYCVIGLELYMEEFSPIDIYEQLGLRPSIYKHKNAKEALTLSYGEWRSELERYYKACEQLSENLDPAQQQEARMPQPPESAQNLNITALDPATKERDPRESKDEPKAFYKIHSKRIAPAAFRRECERFAERIDHKQKILECLREAHNAFIVLKIHAYINPKDSLALNLSPKVSQMCARLGVRILTHIEVL